MPGLFVGSATVASTTEVVVVVSVGSTTETNKQRHTQIKFISSARLVNYHYFVLPSGTHSTFFSHGPRTGHKTPTLLSLQTVPGRQTTRAQPVVPTL